MFNDQKPFFFYECTFPASQTRPYGYKKKTIKRCFKVTLSSNANLFQFRNYSVPVILNKINMIHDTVKETCRFLHLI